MAELVTIARPYAEAAFRLAVENGNLGGWSDTLALLDAVVSDRDVAQHVDDPNTDERALESLLLGLLGDRLDGQGRNFLQLLIHNGRLTILSQIRELYEDLRREHEGILNAHIVSALPMSEEQVRDLVATLEKKYGRKVRAQVDVDGELIGGARIMVGDKMIDATVRGRLDAMASALAQ
jgi:F-type H+-transporting ATPase subunit delta